MSFEIVPAHDVPLAEQASIANQAFAGYVGGWTDLNPDTLARFILLQGADIFYSRFVCAAGALAGFGYINRTGDISRLAGMAMIPSARGTGAASCLLHHLLAEAEERGDRAMILEVIEQNSRANTFYRKHGFREINRLFGWRRQPGAATDPEPSAVEEISILEAIGLPSACEYPTLPWQISPHAIAKGVGLRAFRVTRVGVVIGDPTTQPIRVHGLWSANNSWEDLCGALAAVLARFPGSEFFRRSHLAGRLRRSRLPTFGLHSRTNQPISDAPRSGHEGQDQPRKACVNRTSSSATP